MLKPALARFDHSRTNFNLIHHQINFDATPLGCMGCHADRSFSGSNLPCRACHASNERFNLGDHIQAFGDDCLACHDGEDRMLPFNHGETRFPLAGQHAALTCTACHGGSEIQPTPVACGGCHEEPALHEGLFDPDCSACHDPAAWSPVVLDEETFSHDELSRFNLNHHHLDFSGDPLTCRSCHSEDYRDFAISTCITCHAEDDAPFIEVHQGEFGTGCLDCHDGADRMHNFDHAKVFTLDGKHAEIECLSCHGDHNWVGLSGKCADCHAEPEIHAGSFGLKCEYCHGTGAWIPAQLEIHVFPLDHGEPPAPECSVCHLEKYSEFTCYGCHEHQEEEILKSHLEAGIAEVDIHLCTDCHPTGIGGEARE